MTPNRLLCLFFLFLIGCTRGGFPAFAGSSLQTATPPLIPRAVLFGNPEKTSPQLSPDGKKLAYIAPDHGVLRIWVQALDGSPAKVVTQNKAALTFQGFTWQANSTHVIYYLDSDGNEAPHLFQTNVLTGLTRNLTPFEGVSADFGRQPMTSPLRPNEILVPVYLRTETNSDLYRINLETGGMELATQNPGQILSFNLVANQTFQKFAGIAALPGGINELRYAATPQGPWQVLTKWSPEDSSLTGNRVIGFSPDGTRLWFLSAAHANACRLVEMEIRTRKTRVLAEDPEIDAEAVITHPVKGIPQAVGFYRTKNEWKVLDPSIKADFAFLSRFRAGDFDLISRDAADQQWLISYSVSDGPVSYYLYNRSQRKATFLFTDRPALEPYKLAAARPISFTARDGLQIPGYLTLPVGLAPEKLPTVILVHGGPYARDVMWLNNEVQWLANRGYAVLQVNFRGSTGYGKKFHNAGFREWGGKMHLDILDAKAWAVGQGMADPHRVALMGTSYGGYETLAGLSFSPGEFAAGISICGPSNLETLIQAFPLVDVKQFFMTAIGNPETEAEFLRSRSPLFFADKIQAPLLVGQGANDPRVKQAESDQIVTAMKKAGKPVEYLLFPDEGHGFVKPENQMKFYLEAERFLARYLSGRLEPAGSETTAPPPVKENH